MFITKEQIKERTGYDIDGTTLALAQMMVEAWIGRAEEEVSEASDMAALGRATAFQAIYIDDSRETIEQAGIVTTTANGSTITFDVENMAPHMSPWAVRTCKGLSWYKARCVHTGPIFDRLPAGSRWEYE